jgi:hypothetical protein
VGLNNGLGGHAHGVTGMVEQCPQPVESLSGVEQWPQGTCPWSHRIKNLLHHQNKSCIKIDSDIAKIIIMAWAIPPMVV